LSDHDSVIDVVNQMDEEHNVSQNELHRLRLKLQEVEADSMELQQ